jgi:hypothetical protein
VVVSLPHDIEITVTQFVFARLAQEYAYPISQKIPPNGGFMRVERRQGAMAIPVREQLARPAHPLHDRLFYFLKFKNRTVGANAQETQGRWSETWKLARLSEA